MNEKTLNSFLKDLTVSSTYKFLEQGKDDDEIKSVCEKSNISYPSPDLAFLKMNYATVDMVNRNGCVLPKDEVVKALPTIAGKAIDFDHIRERICGFLLSGELVGDDIIVYGAFFKSSLGEDYDMIRELFDRNNLAVSMEAWGERVMNSDGVSYNLIDIIFCGVGLLINTKPAFPKAGVVEMANKRMLEFAKVEDKTTFIKSGTKDEIIKAEEMKAKKAEYARFFFDDISTIERLTYEVVCPLCKEQGLVYIDSIDFANSKMNVHCFMCDSSIDVKLSPKASIVLKDTASRTITEVTKIDKVEEKSMEKEVKKEEIAEEVIKDEEEIVETTDAEVQDDNQEEVIEEVVEEVKEEVKNEEVAKSASELEELKKEIASLKEQLVKARDEGKVIGERRVSLGEYAKDMSDDDVLDDVKYENASLRKKVAELETTETASVKKNESLEVGAKNATEEKKDKDSTFAANVRKRAWNL